MFKYLIDLIPNAEIYAISGLFIFLCLFGAVVVWVFRLDKKYIEKMGRLPLDSTKKNGDHQDG
jgi:TM2 domain-containing membrane protein YozV